MIKYFQKLKAKKGFTLVELIVVIAIIGVLAAILIPTMLGYVTSSRVASADSTAGTLKDTLNAFITERDGANKGIAREDGGITAYTGSMSGVSSGSQDSDEGKAWNVSVDNHLNPGDEFANKLADKLAADYPNIDNASVYFYVYQGTCIFCAFSTQQDNVTNIFSSSLETDKLEFTKNAEFDWGTTEGLNDGNIVGTSPKLYQS